MLNATNVTLDLQLDGLCTGGPAHPASYEQVASRQLADAANRSVGAEGLRREKGALGPRMNLTARAYGVVVVRCS